MKKNLFSLLLIFFHSILGAQNLVPNGSFEGYKICPDLNNYSDPIQKHLSDDSTWNAGPDSWFSASFGHPVYYNRCSSKFTNDRQSPRTGNGYVGINTYSPHSFFKAYISTRLDSPLVKNEIYCIKFYASLDKNSRYITAFLGMYLSERAPACFNMSPQPYKPQITNEIPFISNDTSWTEISGIYKANGGEKYIIIGDFYPKENGGKLRPPNQGLKTFDYELAYYFIDDVSIIHIKNEFECSTLDKSLVLKNIFFDTGKSILLSTSFPELDKLVASLKQNSNSIEVSGHTDNSGKEADNLKLSEARAKAVADYLVSKGIKKDRVKYKGYGSSKPIAANDTEEGKQQNRRVEIEILK